MPKYNNIMLTCLAYAISTKSRPLLWERSTRLKAPSFNWFWNKMYQLRIYLRRGAKRFSVSVPSPWSRLRNRENLDRNPVENLRFSTSLVPSLAPYISNDSSPLHQMSKTEEYKHWISSRLNINFYQYKSRDQRITLSQELLGRRCNWFGSHDNWFGSHDKRGRILHEDDNDAINHQNDIHSFWIPLLQPG